MYISKQKNLEKVFKKYKPDLVINFAAQAGVKYYKHLKIFKIKCCRFFNVVQLCVKYKVKNLFLPPAQVSTVLKKKAQQRAAKN